MLILTIVQKNLRQAGHTWISPPNFVPQSYNIPPNTNTSKLMCTHRTWPQWEERFQISNVK